LAVQPAASDDAESDAAGRDAAESDAAGREDAGAQGAAAGTNWPLFRGDPMGTGVAPGSLP
jgi:hypothetical protein